MSQPPCRHLIVMAKAPRLGRVKTRLAADVGAVGAWNFYRRNLAAVTRRLGADPRWRTHLGVSPDESALVPALWPAAVPRLGQGTGDLGARMARLLDAMPPGPAVLVGADVPGIRPDHVWAAFRALGRADAVFGPADDGGYWLVGLKRRPAPADMFRGVRWSSSDALADTLANLPAHWRVERAATLSDVDDGAALSALGSDAFSPLGTGAGTG
jgi:rSAM/selenodomain-associated transferase 1